jgi:hypothetical protein
MIKLLAVSASQHERFAAFAVGDPEFSKLGYLFRIIMGFIMAYSTVPGILRGYGKLIAFFRVGSRGRSGTVVGYAGLQM